MATVNIDGTEYELDDLSDVAKGNLASMQLADQKIAQLQSEIAIVQTARNAYARELAKAIETSDEE